MSNEVLIAKMLAQRESMFDVAPGKRLKIRRPAEVEMFDMRFVVAIGIEQLKKIVVGWEGFNETDLLGPSVGASSPVAFDTDVFAVWLMDRGEDFVKVSAEVNRLVREHLEAKDAAAKN